MGAAQSMMELICTAPVNDCSCIPHDESPQMLPALPPTAAVPCWWGDVLWISSLQLISVTWVGGADKLEYVANS